VEFRLLGPVEAVRDAAAVALGGPRQRALLALLLLDPGRPAQASWLAEELWHGEPPAQADATLRSYVSRLRRALGPEAVDVAGGAYTLRATADQVDARRFEQLLWQGRDELARDAAGLASERLHAALALWRGRALGDVAEHGALALEAQRLDELRLVCLEERIEADLALARHATLVPELQALVQEHPLRERLRRLLVLALYRSGRQADALDELRAAQRMLDEELGLTPSEELRSLERAILTHDVETTAPADARHNIASPTTSFVGRGRELAELEQALRRHRLVTVTGLGGTGKTRLTQELALRQAEAWADGVWLVDLTAVTDERLVEPTVASTLRLAEAGELVDALRRRELLLVLDNCEHLVDASAALVGSVLAAAPNVHVLATSRVPLGVPGELDYALDPLTDGAVELFLDRARAVRRDLGDDERARATIAAICDDLDGLPLSIELAAARAKSLSLQEIAERLDDRFRFLRAWQRVADPRHRTLATMMDWSYDLLGDDERRLLRRLAVFAGGATLDAVVAVCDADDELLGRLVDASLVRAEHGAPTRYTLLETVRVYAARRFGQDEDADVIRRRHAEHFLEFAEATNLALDGATRGPQRHALALREQHNLRAAVDYATATDVELAIRLMLALENLWVTHALAEGRRRWEELLPRAGELDVDLQARAWLDYGGVLDVVDDRPAAGAAYARSRELYESIDDEVGTAYLDYRLGIISNHTGNDPAIALALWRRSLGVFRRHGVRDYELQMVGDIGWLEVRYGDPVRGRAMLEESLAMAKELDWLWWQAQNLAKLAAAELEAGRIDAAETWARQGLELCRRMSNRQFGTLALAVLARTAAARGEDERALVLWSAVEACEEPAGRFGKFDRAAFARCMPDRPRPEPVPYAEAVALALAG
jgi:predicted ATPase/DNA-binding SARP family transcriptional activator